MAFLDKLIGGNNANGRRPAEGGNDRTYIDLSDFAAAEKTGEGAASTWVRFAELRALDDLKQFSSYVYDGNLLILDFSKVQGDEILLRRLTNELRKLAQDTGGDIAGLGDHHILLTPTGVKVDRKRLTATKGDDAEPQHVPRTSASPPAAPAPAPLVAPAPATANAPPARTNGGTGRRMANK
jgi:SepF-like predicted cell division protein (DUF552 family)